MKKLIAKTYVIASLAPNSTYKFTVCNKIFNTLLTFGYWTVGYLTVEALVLVDQWTYVIKPQLWFCELLLLNVYIRLAHIERGDITGFLL